MKTYLPILQASVQRLRKYPKRMRSYSDILRAIPAPIQLRGKAKQVEANKQPEGRWRQPRRPVDFDWESITGWPTDPKEMLELRGILDSYIEQAFRFSLPQDLRAYYDASGKEDPELERQLEIQFDRFLVREASDVGARLLIADRVLIRVLQWSLGAKNGTSHLEQFASALVKNAKVRVAEAKGKFNPQNWRRERLLVTPELTALQNELKEKSENQNRAVEVIDIENAILQRPEVYPSLSVNLTPLLTGC